MKLVVSVCNKSYPGSNSSSTCSSAAGDKEPALEVARVIATTSVMDL